MAKAPIVPATAMWASPTAAIPTTATSTIVAPRGPGASRSRSVAAVRSPAAPASLVTKNSGVSSKACRNPRPVSRTRTSPGWSSKSARGFFTCFPPLRTPITVAPNRSPRFNSFNGLPTRPEPSLTTTSWRSVARSRAGLVARSSGRGATSSPGSLGMLGTLSPRSCSTRS